MPDAVIFDLDGVLLDSERRWNEIKREVVEESGGRWDESAPTAMMGMSSPEWSAYLRDELGVPKDAEAINDEVVRRLAASYREELPLLPGAADAVRALGGRWPLGLASSSNREVIDDFLRLAALEGEFGVTLSSEQVERGKPAPDVYLEAARLLGSDPGRTVAVEDSSNGIRAAAAAGMAVIAVPNEHYPPDDDALELAAATIDGVGELTPELVARVGGESGRGQGVPDASPTPRPRPSA
ncbi:MAG TPA: HAD family phosphatase [Solirubrobacterales bacterium]